jgi:hypothetical protein
LIITACQRPINLKIKETTATATVANYRGFGTMTSVKIHLDNKEVLAIENIAIIGFDENGNTQSFPY